MMLMIVLMRPRSVMSIPHVKIPLAIMNVTATTVVNQIKSARMLFVLTSRNAMLMPQLIGVIKMAPLVTTTVLTTVSLKLMSTPPKIYWKLCVVILMNEIVHRPMAQHLKRIALITQLLKMLLPL